MENQIKSRKRVTDHGEVFTSEREVNAMLDLVKNETDRPDSRFLEPACGEGNFLIEITIRKLLVVEERFSKNQYEFERNSIVAMSCIYGIDILQDNVDLCRERLFNIFNQKYSLLFGNLCKDECRQSVKFILSRNILCGDALTLQSINEEPLIFSEWSAVNSSMIKRRDFTFHELLQHEGMKELPLFSDLGDDVFIPEPISEYPLTHFLKLDKNEQY